MFKLILILFIFFYVFYKVGGFIMRALYFGSGKQYQQRQQQSARSRTTTNGRHEEIKVDYIPEEEVKKRKSSSGKIGGEYVDYEEVK